MKATFVEVAVGFKSARKQMSRDEAVEVQEPTQRTEFEVQAFLWTELRRLGINARGEVKAVFAGRATVRFDIAIFQDRKLVGIVEVKAAEIKHRDGWELTRQGTRYAQFGVPVRIVYGMGGAEVAISDAMAGNLFASL